MFASILQQIYLFYFLLFWFILNKKGKGKAYPLQAQCVPEGG